jgi:hypothetical protein
MIWPGIFLLKLKVGSTRPGRGVFIVLIPATPSVVGRGMAEFQSARFARSHYKQAASALLSAPVIRIPSS